MKYGVTRDFVRELKVVLPDGTLTRVGHKTAKGVAGLELAQLLSVQKDPSESSSKPPFD